MAKRKKGKKKGHKGGKKKNRVSRKLTKPGFAESLGAVWSLAKIETDTTSGYNPAGNQKAFLRNPTMATAKSVGTSFVGSAKKNFGPALFGLLISNVDAVPVFGRMLAPTKRKVDRVAKKYTGMKL